VSPTLQVSASCKDRTVLGTVSRWTHRSSCRLKFSWDIGLSSEHSSPSHRKRDAQNKQPVQGDSICGASSRHSGRETGSSLERKPDKILAWQGIVALANQLKVTSWWSNCTSEMAECEPARGKIQIDRTAMADSVWPPVLQVASLYGSRLRGHSAFLTFRSAVHFRCKRR